LEVLTSSSSITTITFIDLIDIPKEEQMFLKDSVKAVRNNAFRVALLGFGTVALVMSLSACNPVSAVKSTLAEDPFPPMPAPEIATYVLDLSGSTNPTAQLEALGSGIADFIAGQSLGNPFAQSPVAPRGLSIQFVTQNSAQAPRILLVSSRSSQDLYQFMKDKAPNIEGARQLWEGLIRARTEIWQNSVLESDPAKCVNQVIKSLGRQQLLPDELHDPASVICQDAKQTSQSLQRLKSFVADPGVEMGSDVAGAVLISLKNLSTAKSEFPSTRLSLVIASDLVDEVSLHLPRRLARDDSRAGCKMAAQDAGQSAADYSNINVVLVGTRNSKYPFKLLDQVHSYWTCYFNQLRIANIHEQSDLSGF
jgi:hypothetical protein